MTRKRGPPPSRQQPEAIVKQARDLRRTQGVDPPGGHLDGERHPVEPTTNFGDEAHVIGGEVETIQHRGRAFDEELHGRGGEGARHGAVALRGKVEGRQGEDPFALDAEGLAGGGQELQPRQAAGQNVDHLRRGLDDVLARVEQDQRPPILQEADKAREGILRPAREANHGGERTRDELGVEDRREVEEDDAVWKAGGQLVRGREGDRRLPDPPRPGDRDEARLAYPAYDRVDEGGAADHAGQRSGQGVQPAQGGAGLSWHGGCVRHVEGGDEPVAAPWDILDVAQAALPVAERPAQGRDVDAQVALLDENVRPNLGDDLLLGHELARPLDEGDEDGEGAAAERDGLAGLEQREATGEEAIRAERNRPLDRGRTGRGSEGVLLHHLSAVPVRFES
jgi:hypothetical protein